MTVVMDSWAIVAFFMDEPAAQQIENIIFEAQDKNISILITSVNLGEVWYSIARAHTDDIANLVIQRTLSLGINIVPVGWDLAYQAAKLKAIGNISYADCFAASLALRESAELYTGDREFTVLEDKINIHWL